MKEALWTAGFISVVMTVFLIFVFAGWPGSPDHCLFEKNDLKPSIEGNTCFCEPFSLGEVLHNKEGVRQPFNTWSNMYVLASGALLVTFAAFQRRKREKNRIPTSDKNRFRMGDFYPIFYIQVAMFLGLGSMFFHASIVNWGGIFDQMSMYTLVAFMISYSLVRWQGEDTYFYAVYPVLCVAFFLLALGGAPSTVVLPIALIPYLVIEIIRWAQDETESGFGSLFTHFGKFWYLALGAFAVALTFQMISDTDGPLCIKSSLFQYHGLWHILAGVMAVMLYFYWKETKV